MQTFKKKCSDCIYSIVDLNVGPCEELSFLKDKLGRFLM